GALHSARAVSAHFVGNIGERDGYVGVPLLVVSLACLAHRMATRCLARRPAGRSRSSPVARADLDARGPRALRSSLCDLGIAGAWRRAALEVLALRRPWPVVPVCAVARATG